MPAGGVNMKYSDFFVKATEKKPFPYQEILAESDSLPDILRAPTGAGKTAAIVLAWLWRRFFASEKVSRSTQSRLIYCLPMRVLVDQTFKNTQHWLKRLELDKKVGLHMLMGGEDAGEWDLKPEQDAIIIGTQDMLLSRALNRGYGMSRYRWPMQFGLLNNDCFWVFDEVQLMGAGLATTTQLDAFREIFGNIAPCKSIWMSATLAKGWLDTVDFKASGRPVEEAQISKVDRKVDVLARRLKAAKKLILCDALFSDGEAIARLIKKVHKSGSLTLVMVNTVDRAVKLFEAVKTEYSKSAAQPELLLIHSRFRPLERKEKVACLEKEIPSAGRIAVTTQVIEAGVDLKAKSEAGGDAKAETDDEHYVSARTLFTELALWASLMQRFGRCNRFGEYEEAEVFWIDVPDESAAPYEAAELKTAREQLQEMEDVGPTSLERHLNNLDEKTLENLFPYSPAHVIRRKDLRELFDTTPDLSGNDIDISRFIRDGDDLDVQVFWRKISDDTRLADERAPGRKELCPVPVNAFRNFLKKKKSAWRWDFLDRKWVRVNDGDVFPGQTYLIPADQGGYDPELGWNVGSTDEVRAVRDRSANEPDANDTDRFSEKQGWQRVREHTDLVIEELARILGGLRQKLKPKFTTPLTLGGRWHDRGKTHKVFKGSVPDDHEHPGDDWAKAPNIRRYERKGFRHELAGALAMLQAGKSDLACYLAAAHHGKVRLSIRSLPTEKPKDPSKRFARGIIEGDELPETDLGDGEIAPEVTLSLEPMELGLSADGKPSWAERMLKLRDDPEIGPFRLAFLEALLRATDMRASRANTLESAEQEDDDA